mgnify:CR=1 FL=1
MGFALAQELASRGAEVVLISGPVQLQTPIGVGTRINVMTAEQMFNAAVEQFPSCDAAIMCAAVADYTPKNTAESKIKRENDNLTIELVQNKDIAKQLGSLKKYNQKLVGFALETDNERENAIGKIKKKNLDFIVLNSMNDNGAGFGHDTNKIRIISKDGSEQEFELKLKTQVAKDIIDKLADIL